MKKTISVLCVVFLSIVSAVSAGDRFAKTMEQMSSGTCLFIEFESVIISDIFDSQDTTTGTLILASDGRYSLLMGEDTYLFDGTYLYSYSPVNEQVVIELEDQTITGEITFITRLDKLYKAEVLTPDKKYRLLKQGENSNEYPDTLIVTLNSDSYRIDTMEYYDINDEKNIITITTQHELTPCADSLFEEHFPPSIERIKLF